MAYWLEKAMSPAVFDHAWRLLKNENGLWRRGLPKPEMEGNLIHHIGVLAQEVLSCAVYIRVICAIKPLACLMLRENDANDAVRSSPHTTGPI